MQVSAVCNSLTTCSIAHHYKIMHYDPRIIISLHLPRYNVHYNCQADLQSIHSQGKPNANPNSNLGNELKFTGE